VSPDGVAVMTSTRGAGQNFTTRSHPGKLKTWKPDALLGLTAVRIPDFQDFRFSPAPDTPEILPTGHGRGGIGGGECPENAQTRAFEIG